MSDTPLKERFEVGEIDEVDVTAYGDDVRTFMRSRYLGDGKWEKLPSRQEPFEDPGEED